MIAMTQLKRASPAPHSAHVDTSGAAGMQRGFQGRRTLDFLRERLATGYYSPGDPLPVDALAAEISVSRQTVLEAMRSLAQAGLVSIVPQVGCLVAVHTKEEIGDFFMLFARVEGLLAGLAATRHLPSELPRLNSINREIDALLDAPLTESERGEQYRLLNQELHGHIHSLARAPEIATLAKGFWDRTDFHLATAPHASIFADRLEIADHEHGAIIRCIVKRDAKGAEKLMLEHILGFRSATLDARVLSPRRKKRSA